jgi:hypothetical protein
MSCKTTDEFPEVEIKTSFILLIQYGNKHIALELLLKYSQFVFLFLAQFQPNSAQNSQEQFPTNSAQNNSLLLLQKFPPDKELKVKIIPSLSQEKI